MRNDEYLRQTKDFYAQAVDEYIKYEKFKNINYLRQASDKHLVNFLLLLKI